MQELDSVESQPHHPGGEPCLAGKRKMPRGFSACCSRFDQATLACTHDIRFEWWLIASGGIGNWIDRLTNDGRVTDFLNVGIGSLRTGIFNVADMALMAGVALYVLGQVHRSRGAQLGL